MDFNDLTAQCLQVSTGDSRDSKGNNKSGQKMRCVYCKKEHLSHKCSVITDIKARHSILRKEKRCYLCTKLHHT